MLLSLLSRWIYSGELSCKLYSGWVSFYLCTLPPIYTLSLLWLSVLLCSAYCQACADPESLQCCSGWLKGSVLGEQLLGLTEELCSVGSSSLSSAYSTSNHSWTLISLVLSQYHNNGKNKHTRPQIFVMSIKCIFVDFLICRNYVFDLF